MSYLYLVLYALIIIFATGLIILAHELGHFIAAAITGVRIERFAFGLPGLGPVIYRKKIFETEFIVHLFFFFGGYIAYPESNPKCELPMDSKKRFLNKTPFQKCLITLSGVFMNIFLSFLIIITIGLIWKFIPLNNYSVNAVFVNNSQNESVINSGIEENDLIYSINNRKINNIIALQEYLRVYDGNTKKQRIGKTLLNNDNKLMIYMPSLYSEKNNKTAELTVIRNNEKIKLNPITPNKDGSLGFNVKVEENLVRVNSVKDIILNSFKCIINQFSLIIFYLKELFLGIINLSDMRGLISILKTGAELGLYDGLYRIMWLISFISINMAFINLVPIPILDGGKFIIILTGDIFKISVKRKTMEKIMVITFKTINIITVLIIINDIIAILRRIV